MAKLKLDVILLLEDRHIHRIFANTAEGFAALHSWIQGQGTFVLSICLELTGSHSDAIVRFLLAQNYVVSLLNPAVLISYRKTKNLRRKTDKVDAYLLALYSKDEQPAACVFVNNIGDLPYIWGTDELKEKSPNDIFASEAISS